ncbi:MAG: TonB-dependent receptor [Vicinamibacterales bacterium]
MVVACAFIVTTLTMFAQTANGVLTGTVTDPTGSVVVGAVVKAVDSVSGITREAVTAADGTYTISALPAGSYTVTADFAGFETARREAVQLAAGGRETVPLELPVGVVIGDVTVYGEKTGRNLLDTPGSVGVVTGARIQAAELFRVEDTFRQIANVNRADWIDSGIVLRGINSEGVGGPSGSPLATTYLDGVPQTANGARRGLNGTWDLQQVEVWRGPQSTVMGRNALAGSIQLRSNDPSMDWQTAGRVGFGSKALNNQAVMLSGPLVDDKLAFRVAAEQQGGHGDVSYPLYDGMPKLDQRADDQYWMARGKVLYRPTGDARSSILATFSSSKDSPSLGDVDGPSAGVAYSDRVWGLQTLPVFVEARATRNDVASVDATVALSPTWTLRSVTGHLVTDTQRPSVDLAQTGAFVDRQLTEEVTVSQKSARLETIAGMFLLKGRTTGNRDQQRSYETFLRRDSSVTDVWNVAGYADVRWKVAGPWTLLGGLRVDVEDQDFSSTNSRLANGTTLTSSNSATSASFAVPLPKAGLSYALSPSSAVSFVAQRAYRAGGSAVNFTTSTSYDFDPEYAWNYEASWHGQALTRGLLRSGVNVFYLDWRDQQVNVPQIPGDFTSDVILNAGRSTVKGAEVEVNWRSTTGLYLYTALGLADTTFKEFSFLQFGQLLDLAGEPFPQAPGTTMTVGAQYRAPVRTVRRWRCDLHGFGDVAIAARVRAARRSPVVHAREPSRRLVARPIETIGLGEQSVRHDVLPLSLRDAGRRLRNARPRTPCGCESRRRVLGCDDLCDRGARLRLRLRRVSHSHEGARRRPYEHASMDVRRAPGVRRRVHDWRGQLRPGPRAVRRAGCGTRGWITDGARDAAVPALVTIMKHAWSRGEAWGKATAAIVGGALLFLLVLVSVGAALSRAGATASASATAAVWCAFLVWPTMAVVALLARDARSAWARTAIICTVATVVTVLARVL